VPPGDGLEAAAALVSTPTLVTQGFTLVPSDFVDMNLFGGSVAIDGNTIAVGAVGHDEFRGAVYLFTRRGQAWQQDAVLVPDDVQPNDSFGAPPPEDFTPSAFFGSAVATQGTSIVVGEPNFLGPAGLNHGSAFVYQIPPR
jgi:hypothetical protein